MLLAEPELSDKEYATVGQAALYASKVAEAKRKDLDSGMAAQDVMDVLEMASDYDLVKIGQFLRGSATFMKAYDALVCESYAKAEREFTNAAAGKPSPAWAFKSAMMAMKNIVIDDARIVYTQ